MTHFAVFRPRCCILSDFGSRYRQRKLGHPELNASTLKRLFSAIQQGSDVDVALLCEKIIAEEKRRGHKTLARDLARIRETRRPEASGFQGQSLTSLPTTRRDSAPLLQTIAHEHLRHHMVLPPDVEARFLRIEKEYAARVRLALHGLRPRNRILLHGPPGCGKSLGAERLAWATGLPLHKVRFDTLLSSYFGETAANLRKVFDAALERPSAIFLDECDTIARARGDRNDVGEASRIVNMLLQLLEEFQGNGLVIAATNLDEALDPAIFRRFDEVLEIPEPGRSEVLRLLKQSFSALKMENTFDWEGATSALEGLSCWEVRKICENAAKRSVLASRDSVTWKDFEGALSEQRRVT